MPDKSANMSQPQDWKLIVEKDVPIKLRDGAVIYCDVLRPDCKEKVPAVTKGWLRASHRKLDPARSLPYRPFHAHNEWQWLSPGEIVECQIEIGSTCMVFRKGHKIRLDIQSRDGAGSQMYGHYHGTGITMPTTTSVPKTRFIRAATNRRTCCCR